MALQDEITSPAAESGSVYIIYVTSVLHLTWAALLISSAAAGLSTPVYGVIEVTGSRAAAVACLMGTALLAVGVSWYHHSDRHAVRLPAWAMALCLTPQQFFLLVSAFTAISAAVDGHYADGTPRAWQFIIGDQLPVILTALLYTTAIVAIGPYPKRQRGAAE